MLEANMDQAASLRRLFGASSLRVLPIVGSAQLAEWYARTLAADRRVVVLDHSGADIAQAFGRPTRFDLASMLWGDRRFEDVATRVNERLDIVPARAGLDQYLQYSREHGIGSDSLFGGFLQLSRPAEWLVMHTRSLPLAAQLMGDAGEIVMMVEDDVEAVKNAYVRIKEAAEVQPDLRIRIVVKALGETRARAVHERIAATTERFLGLSPQFGFALPRAVRSNAQLGARLKAALGHWQLAEFATTPQAESVAA